jgi:RHS repeat-associated protein
MNLRANYYSGFTFRSYHLMSYDSSYTPAHKNLITRRSCYGRYFFGRMVTFILAICCLMLCASSSSAQDIKNSQNGVDSKKRTEAHVDSSTLGLQLQISLGGYPGRGGDGLPITLNYSSKLWRMNYVTSFGGNGENFYTHKPVYGEGSASGWTSTLDWFKWPSANNTFPNGVDMRLEKYDAFGNPVSTTTYSKTVARIHVMLPDGSRHELRRSDTVLAAGSDYTTGTFYSVDGSSLRYESASRTLFMPDGSRLIYSYNASSQPDYIYLIDRNGNQTTYSYATSQWTDTMGRTFSLPPLNNSSVTDYYYYVPGVNGTTLTYTFRWMHLSSVRTDMSQPLRYLGDHTWNSPYGMSSNPALFTSPDDTNRVISNSTAFDPIVLYQIVLPNNQAYTFTYNVWGEIDKIVYPAGAYESFSHATVESLSGQNDDQLYAQTNRGVTSRSVSPSGQGGDNQTWTYGTALDTSVIPYRLTRAITAPDGSYQQIWYHTGRGSATKFGFEDARAGMAFDERVYTANPASGGVMLRRTLTDWSYDGPQPYDVNSTATRNARPTKMIGILLDTGGNALAGTTTSQYDADLNVVSSSQYDYASIASSTGQTGASSSIPAGTLIRTSETTYLVNDPAIASGTKTAYRNRQLLGLSTSSRVKNGAGTIIAQSSTSYDEAAYPLISLGAVTGWTDPATTVRGNVTTTGGWLDTTGTYLQTHAQYDQCGSPVNRWDARGNLTQTQYSSAYAYAFPTASISAVPGGSYSSATSLVSSTAYDFNTGLVTSITDVNNQTTSYEYVDALNRITKITRPTGGGWTAYAYGHNAYGDYIHTQTLQNSTPNPTSDSYQFYDGMGRPYRSFQYEGVDSYNVYLTVDTQYDVMNRVWRVSNTYRTVSAAGAINPSGIWTTNAYDKLGRETSVTTTDNAVVTTSHSGNQVTLTDQAGKRRSITSDALGRVTQVIEDPNGLAYQTDYTYDTVSNLRKVVQGTQTRYYMYDSLSRLIRAKNPEQSANGSLALTDALTGNSQWSLAYAYDNNGNLSSKTDARGVTSSYTYDGLNRNTLINYSDGASTTHYFDGATNGRGRFWLSHHYPASGAYTQTVIESYDAVGQPLSQRVNFWTGSAWSANYMVNRTYDLAGHVATQTYPSGRTVSYTYDRVGRTASFTGNLGDSVSRTYMTAIAFDDSGRMTREQFGTDTALYHKQHWNNRGQLYDMRLSTVNDEDNWNRGAIVNYYSLSNMCFGPTCTGTDTNGNLQIQQHFIPTDDAINGYSLMQENYAYDGLNRMTWVGEYMNGSGATPSGAQNYSHDRWGNHTINATTWGTGINNKQFTVDDGTNRLGVPSGQSGVMQYDANGNLTNDTYTSYGSRTFDGENRMVTAWDSSGQQSIYTYDGNGRRVRRKVGAQAEVWQVYGMGGELMAEYSASAAATSPQKEYGYRGGELLITAQASANVQWVVTDQLGTPRMVADRTGSLAGIRRHDYLPFGEELFVGSGNRTTGQGYVADGVRQKFTGQERDLETGLDYFIARYHASVQGRFISPDSVAGSTLNPQTLNLYAYVQNNPLKFTDPTGHHAVERDARWRKAMGMELPSKREAWDQNHRALLEQWRVQDYGAMYLGMQQEPQGQAQAYVLTEDNPPQLASDPQNSDCNITVVFTGPYSGPDVPGVELGEGTIKQGENGSPLYGLGFVVYGSVRKGGIGHIGETQNKENPNGAWTIQQWVWNYTVLNGRVAENSSEARPEKLAEGSHLINGNRFQYYDHPGIGPGVSGYKGSFKISNFAVKVLNGNKGCEVKFHMLIDGTKMKVTWGQGNF